MGGQPAAFVGHLIGREGRGTLTNVLKDRGWIHGLCAGEGAGAKGFSTFDISVNLTEQGLHRWTDVVLVIFAAIKQLKDAGAASLRRTFDELASMNELHWRFEERDCSVDAVQQISGQMLDGRPAQDLLWAPYERSVFDAKAIDDVVDQLKPDGFRLCIGAKSFDGIEWSAKEERYKVAHALQPFPEDLLADCAEPVGDFFDGLELPSPNHFIPVDVKPIRRESVPMPEEVPRPQLATSGPSGTVWHYRDRTFLVPRVQATFLARVPMARRSTRDAVRARLPERRAVC